MTRAPFIQPGVSAELAALDAASAAAFRKLPEHQFAPDEPVGPPVTIYLAPDYDQRSAAAKEALAALDAASEAAFTRPFGSPAILGAPALQNVVSSPDKVPTC